MSDPDTFPDGALEDMAYLSRSKNRARILAMLAADARTRRELGDVTGIPRTTLDRIVNEFEARDWVTRSPDGDYVATPIGERVATASTDFLGAVQAIRTLGEAVAWLPDDELTIGLHHFADATVRRPGPNAVSAPSTFVTELMREASEFACLVNTPPSLGFEDAMMNGVFDGRLTTTHVITEGELAVLRQDADRMSRWRAYVEAGANLYCYDDRIPCNLLIIDGTVVILARQPEAAEGIESTNPVVRSWAQELIDEYREDAERLDAATFT